MDMPLTRAIFGFIFISLSGITVTGGLVSEHTTRRTNSPHNQSEIFKIVDWKLAWLKTYFIYSFFIIIVILIKILHFNIPKVSAYITQSCMLIVTGVLFGVIVRFAAPDDAQSFKLTPNLFFVVLLPPIILESSYSLFHRNLLGNILTILVFAVFGTLLNFLIIGLSLYGLSRFRAMMKLHLSLMHCLVFSSVIIAVNSGEVLNVLQEIGVDPDLYYVVFGESLLNDAFTVVLYDMVQEFALMPKIRTANICLGFVSFFIVTLGGMLIGIGIGALSCLIIRGMRNKKTFLMEPILLMSAGYLAYLCGEVLGWSGIISCVACGVIQASYAFLIISDNSRLVLKRFVKLLAIICEAVIYLYLGVELVGEKLKFDATFTICSIFLCFVTRFLVTFSLFGIANKIRVSVRSVPLKETIIISYGGLRGVVAYSLATLLKHDGIHIAGINEEIIISTTLFIILFTVIIQGITLKPIVSILKISRKKESPRRRLLDELNESVIEMTTSGINSILGKGGRNYFYNLVNQYNNRYVRTILHGNISHSDATVSGRTDSCHNLDRRVQPQRKSKLSVLPELKVDHLCVHMSALSTDGDSIYESNQSAVSSAISRTRRQDNNEHKSTLLQV